MDKDLIIKYISKTATKEEAQQVLEWANLEKENETLLAEMMNKWVADHMPENEADDRKYEEFLLYRKGYDSSSEKFRKRTRINIFAWSIAAAVILFLLGWNIFLTGHKGETESISSTMALATPQDPASNMRTLYTDKGVKAQIMLPDSSMVWLNSDTRIEYPEVFDKAERKVKLSGEAYFEVKSDSLHPMIITTDKGFQIKVTGTSFNVKAYNDDNVARTTLYSGSISLLYKGAGNTVIEKKMRPNQCVDLYDEKIRITKNATEEQLESASIWKAGRIHFESTPLSEAIKTLNRWHGTQFKIENPEVLEYRITANFENESIVQIMELIKMTTYIDYSISGKEIIITKR